LLNAAKALGFLIKHGIGAPGPMAEAQAKIYLKLRQAHPDASEKDILGTMFERAKIENFRFHDLRHTFASSYMMNGGDLYELAKILGHSNIKMTERYAKVARNHIAKTGSTAREIWKLMEQEKCDKANVG
jgi:site-specific recombinase XerD